MMGKWETVQGPSMQGREGVEPTHMWSAIDCGSLGLVALVGTRRVPEAFVHALAELEHREMVNVPVAVMAPAGEGSDSPRSIMMVLIGLWPYEQACDVVRELVGDDQDSPREWAQRLEVIARREPHRIFPSTYRMTPPALARLAQHYQVQCLRATGKLN